ncbi:glycine betaine ABC transporter substrate-binding protein [Gulosibacter sp. 10]|uniref:glycine betaine ABC transporter substrate-binding protein n=1 Tax=Gulosibacter sp. 10 TaxID=1255570 RepID=UPI00097EAB44|nr:glycine betaine ABC transporter substrate-binding protein [Gulosibacter sp. 10]SJM50755.1 ABC-type glycine betaine transport, permease protein [Gulosibacter sp. 10]
MRKGTFVKALATAGVAGLALAGCAGGEGATLENGDQSELTIAVFSGWEEGIAVSELWKHVLEEQGYSVSLEYADAAPVYTGLAGGDYDVTLDGWLPVTHGDYMEEYGDQLVNLGAWNEDSYLTFAVNEDAPITSLDELADHADEFGNTIYGIDPGAGLTQVTQEEVIPTYGLEGMEYSISSTPGMLTSLEDAINKGENVVVTLWRPHWAYDAYPIRDLEDPEGALGGTETLNAISSTDFEETHPTAAGWISEFAMDSEMLYELENLMFNENEGTDDYGPIIEQWAAENQEYVDGLTD